MNYIKLFDNFDPNHYINSSDEIDESLLNGIDAILLPITDDIYNYNHYIYDSDEVYNDKKKIRSQYLCRRWRGYLYGNPKLY